MKQNPLLKIQAAKEQVLISAAQETIQQMMADTLCLTLNDPEIMGRGVFGKMRLNAILQAWMVKYNHYFLALMKGPEQEVYQAHLDSELRQIFGSDIEPFEKRYEMVVKPDYQRKAIHVSRRH